MKPILYNITFKVAHDFLEEWQGWIENVFMPQHMNHEFFQSYKVLRIFGSDAEDGVAYAIQFVVDNIVSFQRFAGNEALDIAQIQKEFCGEKALSFSTVMEIVKQD